MDAGQLKHGPIGVVVLAVLGGVLVVGVVVGVLVVAGFFNSPTSTRSSAELAAMTSEALAESPGLAYDLSIEVAEGGALQGFNSSGLIDLQGQRFSGSADKGRGAAMLLAGGPGRGSLVVADGLFVQADGEPWEAFPRENARPLSALLDPNVIATAVGAAIERAEVDPAIRTEPCGVSTCQVVRLLLPPQTASDVAVLYTGQLQPPPPDLLPIEAELWLDPETGFPRHTTVQGVAGGTTTRIALDLERLDPPPPIDPPVP